MATTPNTTRETVNEAASEAIRATSEASRRTLLSAQDAMRTTRTYMAESTEANRKLFNAYVKGCEAAMRNTFEVRARTPPLLRPRRRTPCGRPRSLVRCIPAWPQDRKSVV